MKRFYAFILAGVVSAGLLGQPPQLFSYQAVIRDANGALVRDKEVGIRIHILITSETGPAVYIEDHSPTTDSNGLVNLKIGTGEPVGGIFTNIDWSEGTYFIKIQADTDGGTNYSVAGVSQILSVPYALYAKTAEKLEPHYVGENYGGGIVFYVYDNGQHGLIVSPNDLSPGSRWYAGGVPGIYTSTMAKGNGVNSGRLNTAIIIAAQGYGDGETYAARICNEYSGNTPVSGFGDWYLPSRRELHLLYLQHDLIGGFAAGPYWSSTEANSAQAWSQDFNTSLQAESTKNSTFRVRAIRSF